ALVEEVELRLHAVAPRLRERAEVHAAGARELERAPRDDLDEHGRGGVLRRRERDRVARLLEEDERRLEDGALHGLGARLREELGVEPAAVEPVDEVARARRRHRRFLSSATAPSSEGSFPRASRRAPTLSLRPRRSSTATIRASSSR